MQDKDLLNKIKSLADVLALPMQERKAFYDYVTYQVHAEPKSLSIYADALIELCQPHIKDLIEKKLLPSSDLEIRKHYVIASRRLTKKQIECAYIWSMLNSAGLVPVPSLHGIPALANTPNPATV